MHQRLLIFALALAGMAGAPSAMAQYGGPPSDFREQVVRCESTDGRERHCALDTRGGVRMARQLSRSACIQGQSWGTERGGIWVAQGCRAEFVAGHGGREPGRGNAGRIVRCESSSGRSNLCVMDTRRGVELVRQLSRSACIREQSWGWNDQGVWVSGGCRAEFRIRGGGRGRDWDDGAAAHGVRSVRCESTDGRVSHCPVDTRGGVRLVRQLSRTPCIEDRNWGHDRRGVWVDGGCRADFEASDRQEQRWGGR